MVSILGITYNRVSDLFQVTSDLVHTACFWVNFQQGIAGGRIAVDQNRNLMLSQISVTGSSRFCGLILPVPAVYQFVWNWWQG